MVFSGIFFNNVLFFERILRASASRTNGKLFLFKKSVKPATVLSFVPIPTPIPTTVGSKSNSMLSSISSLESVITITSGREV